MCQKVTTLGTTLRLNKDPDLMREKRSNWTFAWGVLKTERYLLSNILWIIRKKCKNKKCLNVSAQITSHWEISKEWMMSLNGVANNLLANKMFHSNKANTAWVIFPKLKKRSKRHILTHRMWPNWFPWENESKRLFRQASTTRQDKFFFWTFHAYILFININT